MSDSIPFWQEVRRSLMVRGDGWKAVIQDLPNHVSFAEAQKLVQSADQLTRLNGFGYIAGAKVQTQFDGGIALPFLEVSTASALPRGGILEIASLQWLYRFIVVEAVVEHARSTPLAEWNRMLLHMVDEGLHFMVYMAAVLVLAEEGADVLMDTEQLVRDRVAKACEFLHPKAQDYGESFRRHGLPGLLPRLWDKIARYAQLKADNREGNFEKKEDSARDLLGYSIIAYSLMLELPEELRKSYQPTSVYETDSNVMEGAEWRKVN
jgi:hypothetical protein